MVKRCLYKGLTEKIWVGVLKGHGGVWQAETEKL